MTYHQDKELLLSGKLSCVDIVSRFLKPASLNEHNAFIEVYEQSALEQAAQIDLKLSRNEAGSLAGLVFTTKDLIATKDGEVTAGSKILQGYHSPFNATAVDRLLSEDAILIGRTNCDEFGMGSSNENSHYGPVLNPHDKSRVPGGSSGGSAVSVAEQSCHIALGTDTGGSVRQPAAFCGIHGLKPTYSRISRYGLLAYASSFDTIGILGNSTEDVELVFDTIAGPDPMDATCARNPEDVKVPEKLSFGYLKQAINTEGIQPEIREAFLNTMDKLKSEGHEVTEIDFPEVDYTLPAYYILTTAEASSNLSRYDGLRFGNRDIRDSDHSLEEHYVGYRSSGFGKEVKRRIFLGTFVLSAKYYDAYYSQAQKARRLLRDKTLDVLDKCTVLLSPVTPTTAFPLNSRSKDPLQMYLSDLFTVHASVCGLPAISIPAGRDQDGLPFGIQAMTRDFGEKILFQFSDKMQTLMSK